MGYRNQLDLTRLEAQLAQAVAALPDVVAQIYQNIYALSLLTGNLPETLLCELLPIQPLPPLPLKVAMGLRSDLVRRRPDVHKRNANWRRQWQTLELQLLHFSPSFILAGDIGLQSLHLSNLFQARSLMDAFGESARSDI